MPQLINLNYQNLLQPKKPAVLRKDLESPSVNFFMQVRRIRRIPMPDIVLFAYIALLNLAFQLLRLHLQDLLLVLMDSLQFILSDNFNSFGNRLKRKLVIKIVKGKEHLFRIAVGHDLCRDWQKKRYSYLLMKHIQTCLYIASQVFIAKANYLFNNGIAYYHLILEKVVMIKICIV